MAWHEVFKNALYKNNTGCFLKKEKDEFVIFDQEGQLIRIPLIDIFENPVYKYSEFDLKISASENLPILSPVNFNGLLANSDNTDLPNSICLGITIENILNGNEGKIKTSGIIENSSWNWTVNETIFLNGNTLSQVKPETGFIQKIGIAKTANSILLKISDAIIL
ncbi:MAG: hypothetical protein IPL26_00190 [Leptospiraceae bacterium]|nr:hypothetical protein [Leptospiraceae bacterium]